MSVLLPRAILTAERMDLASSQVEIHPVKSP